MKQNDGREKMRAAVLRAALVHAAFDGWTDETLARAAKEQGAEARALFPRGARDLAVYFSAWADAEMLKKLSRRKTGEMRVRDRVAEAVEARLDVLTPHRAAVSAALAFLAPPPRHLALPKMVWATADAIWRFAGDTATDYNHYTKRILLSGVLTATTLYWLNDTSDGLEDTRAFLSRRIDEVLKIGKAMGGLRRKKTA